VFCLPVLLYGAETENLSSMVLNGLVKTKSQALMKIFKTFDKNIILNCQYDMGPLSTRLVLGQRKLFDLAKMKMF